MKGLKGTLFLRAGDLIQAWRKCLRGRTVFIVQGIVRYKQTRGYKTRGISSILGMLGAPVLQSSLEQIFLLYKQEMHDMSRPLGKEVGKTTDTRRVKEIGTEREEPLETPEQVNRANRAGAGNRAQGTGQHAYHVLKFNP